MEYFQTDSGQSVLIFIVIGVLITGVLIAILIKKQSESEQNKLERQQRLVEQIIHFTKRDFVKDFSEISNFGWVKTSGESTREEVENTLKLHAAERGANAVTKFSWQSDKETYEAGKSKSGNPYYRSRTVYGGEAVAVLLENLNSSRKNIMNKKIDLNTAQNFSKKKPDFERYAGKKVVLDGNNIVGRSEWSFDPLTTFLIELARSDYEFTLFFDNNIYRTLRENNLISTNETIQASISRVVGIEKDRVVVTPARVEADPFIIEFAMRQNAAIISNDGYTDFRETYPSLNNDQLINFELVDNVILAPKLNLSNRFNAKKANLSANTTNDFHSDNEVGKEAHELILLQRGTSLSAPKSVSYDESQKAFYGTHEMLVKLTTLAIQELKWEVSEVNYKAGYVFFKTGWTWGSTAGVSGSISIKQQDNSFFKLTAECKHILAPGQIAAFNIGKEAEKKGVAVINKMIELVVPYLPSE